MTNEPGIIRTCPKCKRSHRFRFAYTIGLLKAYICPECDVRLMFLDGKLDHWWQPTYITIPIR